MNRLEIILMLVVFASYGQKKDDWLKQIEKSAQQGFRGEVKASVLHDEHGMKYINVNFKDANSQNNFEPPYDQIIDRINSIVFYSLPREQKNTLDYLKLSFENEQ